MIGLTPINVSYHRSIVRLFTDIAEMYTGIRCAHVCKVNHSTFEKRAGMMEITFFRGENQIFTFKVVIDFSSLISVVQRRNVLSDEVYTQQNTRKSAM